MKNTFVYIALAGLLLLTDAAVARPLPAELFMGKDRSWQGQVISRDGDWIEFNTGASAKPIRIGVSTIKALNFKVDVDTSEISNMMTALDYEGAISALSKTLQPFEEYQDIPNNLGKYSLLLAELYYRSRQYEKSLVISTELSRDDRNPMLQAKAQVYRALALIDAENVDDAANLLVEFGWDGESTPDASAEELFIRAKLKALNGEHDAALLAAARIVAFHSHDADWMQPAELLCAELYTELGMYDSAEEVCNQIHLLYRNSQESEKAAELEKRIRALRAENN